ncbi:MAG: hypothetical protein N3D14_05135 [Aquificaceae bacterium]|nr:hypothetical protein [Aquificaceae bacterium]
MKLDLSGLIKKDTNNSWTPEEFKLHLQDTLIEIIRLELENLPEKEWERTLHTWRKICAFCKGLMKKEDKERHELYKKFGFDSTMVHISESLVEKLKIAQDIGIMRDTDEPDKIIKIGLENMEESSREIVFMKGFWAS